MIRDGYEKDRDEAGNILAQRLRDAGICVAFMDPGWKVAWKSTTDHHPRIKYHTPPITIFSGMSTDALANGVFDHLNRLYASYKGLLIKEDLRSHVMINSLSGYGYGEEDLEWVLVFQATVIHVSERAEPTTRMKSDEAKN